MGFLKRLLGGTPQVSWPPPGPITSWPDSSASFSTSLPAVLFEPTPKMVDVVGESHYQGSLERLAGGRTIDGPKIRDHTAILLLEPSNPYDVNAVRVLLVAPNGDGATIGYLSRENAVAYRPVIDRLAADGKVAACRASVSGGWDRGGGDRGSFGVRLSIGTPDEAMKELDD